MKTKKEALNKAVEVLKSGGVILYLSDTIWGLGCDARNEDAIQRIFDIKKRNDTQPLITLIGNDYELQSYVSQVPELAWDFIELSESPLSIVYNKVRGLADNVKGADGSAAIRVVQNSTPCSDLLKAFRGPLVSTSANIIGTNFSGYFKDVSDKIKLEVDFILETEADILVNAKPSKVIKLGLNGDYKLLRG